MTGRLAAVLVAPDEYAALEKMFDMLADPDSFRALARDLTDPADDVEFDDLRAELRQWSAWCA